VSALLYQLGFLENAELLPWSNWYENNSAIYLEFCFIFISIFFGKWQSELPITEFYLLKFVEILKSVKLSNIIRRYKIRILNLFVWPMLIMSYKSMQFNYKQKKTKCYKST